MAKEPNAKEALDRDAYEQADRQFKVLSDRLPAPAVEAVAREVMRRLAFRLPHSVTPDHLPTKQEIARLCDAILSDDEVAGDRIILAASRDGVPLKVIHLSYIAEAARELGRKWDRDEISFVDVTLASSRLYRIIRGLRHVLAEEPIPDEQGAAVLALVPGETHTLGVEIAGDLFRRAGWDLEVLVGMDEDQISDALDRRPVSAVVIVAQTDREIPALLSLVVAVRLSQPLAYIVLAGNILNQVEDAKEMIGADAVIRDLDNAVVDLAEIIGG